MINPFEIFDKRLENIEMLLLNLKHHEPTYLPVNPASDLLACSPNALRVKVCKGQIPYIKKGGKLFFLESDLIDYLESGRVDVKKAIEPVDALVANKKRATN
jgi:hypothetical protein